MATISAAGAFVLPGSTAAGMPRGIPSALPVAGSLGVWQQGQWWVDAARLRTWHQQGVTGRGVTIALVDGPVASGVPELAGQDVRPSGTLCDREPWRQWGPTTPDGPLDGTSIHTTSMAALMVGGGTGTGPGGVGVLGVAPGATLRTYAVFNTKDPAAHQDFDCRPAGYAGLIDQIVADGAAVIDIPVSIDAQDDAVQAAYNRAFAHGVVIVASSGNGGAASSVMSPGGNHGILVVGGVGSDGQVLETNPTSRLTSWDQARTVDEPGNIHLVAPGSDLMGGGLTSTGRWSSTVLQSGSSGASAIIAGQLALMRQRWPSATGNQLVISLLRSAVRPAGSPVWDPRRGFGTTSFEATLTTDPTGYADLQPIYTTMANVYSDRPTVPSMPQALDADGSLPRPPTGSVGGSTAGSAAAAPGAGAAAAVVVSSTSDTVWLIWLLAGVVAVGALFGGGWWATRNRRASSGVDHGEADGPYTPDEGEQGRRETAGTTISRSAGRLSVNAYREDAP